jgi:[ribosomal protein S5]-alanine N-acetyltransferase
MPDIIALTTARLQLRGVTMADAPAIQKNFDDYEIIRYLAAIVPWPYPADGARDFLNSVLPVQGDNRWVWGLFLHSAPAELIGIVDLRRNKTENRGFWLARRFWDQGLMSEACDAVTDYAFGPLGFERLILCNAAGNARSRRIKEKAGATFLRVEPAKFVDPALTTHEVWELRRADWLARRKGDYSSATMFATRRPQPDGR